MDSHLFRLFADAATPYLLRARVEKIREPYPGLLAMGLRAEGKNRVLYFYPGKNNPFIFLSDLRLAANSAPPAPIMRVRKYFADKRLVSVVPQFVERKLWLLANNRDSGDVSQKAVWLCLDLARGFSLNFLDPEEAPRPDAPAWPAPEDLETADWRAWPVLTPALRKTLKTLDKPDALALLGDLREGGGCAFLYSRENEVASISAWPLALPELRESVREDVVDAIARAGADMVLTKLAREGENRALAPARRKARKLRDALEKLNADEARLKALILDEKPAKAIYAQLWRYGATHKADFLIAENPESGESEKINLDKRYDLRENAERLFARARKGKRGLLAVTQRRAALMAELESLEDAPAPREKEETAQKTPETANRFKALKKTLPKNIQAFLSSDGFVILRGKDAKGNRALRKYAAPHDIWLHALDGPGAHVIVRRPRPGFELPENTLDEAGALAANKSWLCEAGAAPIEYAESRYVKPARKGPEGKVIIDKILFTRVVVVDKTVETRLCDPNSNRENGVG